MRHAAALLSMFLALVVQPAAAQQLTYTDVSQIEVSSVARALDQAERRQGAKPQLAYWAPIPKGIATFGPFRVLDGRRAALVGGTNTSTPRQFAALLRRFPRIATIEMIACPGTEDDRANLQLGLLLHAKGIATDVPERGFVASGAVDLFLAGAHRSAHPAAVFAVHSWLDVSGHEPKDYPPDAPKNRAYIDYYMAVGMSADGARTFYAVTNSVPSSQLKWLTRAEIAKWIRLDPPSAPTN